MIRVETQPKKGGKLEGSKNAAKTQREPVSLKKKNTQRPGDEMELSDTRLLSEVLDARNIREFNYRRCAL